LVYDIFRFSSMGVNIMAIPQRIIVVTSSIVLLLLLAVFFATSIELRAPRPNLFQLTVAKAQKAGEVDRVVEAKAKLNGTDFDRGDVWHGTLRVAPDVPKPSTTTTREDPHSSANWSAEGVIGPIATSSPIPTTRPEPPTRPQIPIVALSYSGSGGPKHCRGELLQEQSFPPPLEQWKNGTCINLLSEARCGVFFSSKGDNCEAQLFNTRDCYNTSRTYVNTVVFMPEERPVGALWSSMWVKCGVDVPEAKMLDPSILGEALRKKPPRD
jgi:hypothetical protein